jgi:hypothetical protein
MRLVPTVLLGLLALTGATTTARAQDAPPADAPVEDPIKEAKRLFAEAKPFFNTAGDTELSQDDRKAARKEAYTRLKKARALLDAWLEEHPDDAEKLDDLYSEIATMAYWVKKEAGIGELEGVKPRTNPPPPPSTGPESGTAPGSGNPSTGPSTGPAPSTGPVAPEPPKPPSAADALDRIREYEKKFPGDVPGLHEKYTEFLQAFPDPASDEYAAAAARVEEYGQRLKDVYRLARDDDPDSLQGVDDSQVEGLIKQLSPDLADPSEPVRVRAAKFLGGLGSGSAATPLLVALRKETDDATEFHDAASEALAKIGGRRVTKMLIREKPTSPMGPTVVKVLIGTVKRGGVNARIAGEALAEYVRAMNEMTQHDAVAALREAGKDGALGLSVAVDLSPPDKRVEYIEYLGTAGEPRVVGYLARFLSVSPPPGLRARQHKAAQVAIETIGRPGVRYLIPALDEKDSVVWTGELLRKITGQNIKDDKRKTWEKWYRANRREFENR